MKQALLIDDASDLPLFSGTPMRATIKPFAPAVDAASQTAMFCGKRLFGFMPPCALAPNHPGDCADGFGGFYSHETTGPLAPFCVCGHSDADHARDESGFLCECVVCNACDTYNDINEQQPTYRPGTYAEAQTDCKGAK